MNVNLIFLVYVFWLDLIENVIYFKNFVRIVKKGNNLCIVECMNIEYLLICIKMILLCLVCILEF